MKDQGKSTVCTQLALKKVLIWRNEDGANYKYEEVSKRQDVHGA